MAVDGDDDDEVHHIRNSRRHGQTGTKNSRKSLNNKKQNVKIERENCAELGLAKQK